ncbi:MAG TPA: SLC13 family permease [Candidatus Limnocylindrales bacterium]|nr:SLC13 family permease [Candidatus Limnocylindrales bacterium]
MAALVLVAVVIATLPTPNGLSREGQRVLAVVVLAVGLWSTAAVPPGVTGLVVVAALTLSGGVPNLAVALSGFADPVAYFLLGVLTIGLAVSKSGLAGRVARLSLRRSGGRPRALYGQMLLAFPVLTLLLPSATTRTAILVHVYEEALALSDVPRGAPLGKAIMLALNSVNRLASTVLLTGGITPIVSAGLIGGISWGHWFVLMSVPYAALLAVGALLIYAQYRGGFEAELMLPPPREHASAWSPAEVRTLLITLGAALLWLTDAVHPLHPALPALLAWICFLAPGIGVLTWSEFERGIAWANLFVLAASLSLAHAIIRSGAGSWLAAFLLGMAPSLAAHPMLLVLALLLACACVRLLIPNITGYLALTIPVAMSLGSAAGLNPMICGLVAMIAGDAVLYYPAQSASSLVVYERGHLTAPEIFRFGLWMTLVGFAVVLVVAIPYWTLVGSPLVVAPPAVPPSADLFSP